MPLHTSHSLQGLPSTGCSQFTAFAKDKHVQFCSHESDSLMFVQYGPVLLLLQKLMDETFCTVLYKTCLLLSECTFILDFRHNKPFKPLDLLYNKKCVGTRCSFAFLCPTISKSILTNGAVKQYPLFYSPTFFLTTKYDITTAVIVITQLIG